MNSHWEKEILLADLVTDKVISLDRGRVISSIDLYKKQGVYPVYSSSAQKNGLFGHFSEYDFDEEMITWSVDGGGYFFYRPKHKFSVTNVAGLLRILKPDYDYKFLFYCLDYQHSNQIYDYVDKAHPSVIKKRYFIPDISISEQQKIAEILTKMDDAIANTQAMIDKYENIKKGLMQDLLTKGIDEHGNIRSEETHQFKDSPLGRIPVEWELSSIADLGNWKGGKTPSKSQPRYWEKGSVLWFSSKDITEDTLSNSFYKISRNAVIETNQTIFPAHKSLIFVFRSGILRHTFPIAKSKSDFTVNQDIKVLLPRNKIKTDFLFFLFKNLESIILKSYVKAGTTVESIDGKAFFKIDVGIPDEIEQQRIIDVISTVYENINNKKLELEKLKIKKIGLMQDLLSGKVRVPN